jgi:hypothetical protein
MKEMQAFPLGMVSQELCKHDILLCDKPTPIIIHFLQISKLTHREESGTG